MSPRTKSILLLVAVFAIGGLVGALIQARMAEQRIEQIASHRSERGFVRFMERGIEPVDDAQAEQIRSILRTSSGRMAEQARTNRQSIRAIVDSTRAELNQVLTPEQQQALREHVEQSRPMLRRGDGPNRARRGPPGDRRLPGVD
jgi:prophage DNA circulation protein